MTSKDCTEVARGILLERADGVMVCSDFAKYRNPCGGRGLPTCECFDFLNVLITALRSERAAGKEEGIEEAAKTADDYDTDAAQAIRSLPSAKKEGK